MKRAATISFSAIAAIALAGLVALHAFPGFVLGSLQAVAAWNAGFESRTAVINGYTAHFYEAGPENGPVVVLLHGLIDEKNSFVFAAAPLVDTHRVILPDLQGHGENAQTEGRDYSIRGQVAFVMDLLETLGVDELIIGGNSMGGHIAAAFALSQPARVEKLLILNATGMLLDAPPTYYTYPDDIDLAYVTTMYNQVFIEPPAIPGPIMGHLARDLNAKAGFYNAVVDAVVTGEDFRLDERVGGLDVSTLIIWGKGDQVVPFHYAEAYHAVLPESELVVLEVGHAPQMEMPDAVGAKMRNFIVRE